MEQENGQRWLYPRRFTVGSGRMQYKFTSNPSLIQKKVMNFFAKFDTLETDQKRKGRILHFHTCTDSDLSLFLVTGSPSTVIARIIAGS